MPTPATATPSNLSPRLMRRLDRPEAVDHDVVAVVGLVRSDLEVELELHADLEVVGPAEQDRLDARALGQVDLADAVARRRRRPSWRTAARGTYVHVQSAPAGRRARRRRMPSWRHLRAHQPAREEDLAAARAPAAEQPRAARRDRRGCGRTPPRSARGPCALDSVRSGIGRSGSRSRLRSDAALAARPSTGRGACACRASRSDRAAWRR